MAKVKLRVPRLVNVGPGARLNLERRKIKLDRGSIGSSPRKSIGPRFKENERDFVFKSYGWVVILK